uniref:Uncharacterized protein n=1 Tax=Oryza brachyantha TaxID=4533 RepID=J3N9D9_ORYBR
MASFMPNHSTMLLASLFLIVLATSLVSTTCSKRGRVLESEEDRNVRYAVGDRKAYFEELCIDARDPEPGVKALETLFPKLEYRFEVTEFVTSTRQARCSISHRRPQKVKLIPHVIANWTAEAKALADPLIAAAIKKGQKLPKCLESCTASLDEVSNAMSGLPATINFGYPKVEKFLRKSFAEDAGPPMCVSGCPDKSCSPEEKIIADKFHDIWGLMDCVEPYADNYLAQRTWQLAVDGGIVTTGRRQSSVVRPKNLEWTGGKGSKTQEGKAM